MRYAIEYKRGLNKKEIKLIRFLLIKEKPELLKDIQNIKVIGRCGCGKCPTIMFGNSFDDIIKSNQPIIADYFGKDKNGNPIGVILMGNNQIAELAFDSIDGQNDVTEIPDIQTLEKSNLNNQIIP